MRMRSKWHNNEKQRTPMETSSALAFIYWQCAMDRIKHLRTASFTIFTPEMTITVIKEILIFLLHITDRKLYAMSENNDRAEIIQLLAKNLSNTFAENASDALGKGLHQSEFIDLLNQRISEYSHIQGDSDALRYSLSRALAAHINYACTEQDKPWVSAQLIEIEIPVLFEKFDKATSNLLVNS